MNLINPPIPRPYQADAIDRGISYFNDKKDYNAFQILPTGSGKSIVIANIAKELPGPTVVFQPSKEILSQNFSKFMSYGYRAGIYSASAGHKFLDKITFATIGSVVNKKHLFKDIEHIIVDECDLVSPKGGMYHDFIKAFPDSKVLGLTATPYRLTSNIGGAMLKFLNRTNPRIFNKCIYYIQNKDLFDSGNLTKLQYFSFDIVDRKMLDMNKAGTDFTESSIRAYYRKINMVGVTISYANRLLLKRKNLLVFCSLVSEAEDVAKGIPGAVVVSATTPQKDRDRILSQFKSGRIRCVVNVGVLTVGFDFPALECILIARSTMSLRLYYQMCGRAMRPAEGKENAWIVDLGGNIKFFGKIETMEIRELRGLLSIWNNGRQLTNVTFVKD